MSRADPLIRKKVKDEHEGIIQAHKIRDLLEEVDFSYDLGLAGPIFLEMRRHMTQAIGYYERHLNPKSPMRGSSKDNLRAANKVVVGNLIKILNTLLEASGKHGQIVLPTSIAELERVCTKLFFYAGEPTNVGKSQGCECVEDGNKDASPIPMA